MLSAQDIINIWEKEPFKNDSQFSVTMGFTSSTMVVTFRTASVFAISSPIPDDPCDEYKRDVKYSRQACTSCYKYNLLPPFKGFWCKEKVATVPVQTGKPFEGP